MFRKNMGIDLGTSSVLIYVRGKGIVLREPAVVAIDKKTMKILKVGFEAQEMLGRTPKNIAAVHPMRDGIISDYDSTEQMLRYFIRKANGNSIFPPNAVVCVPSRINEVEERAVRQAVTNAGAKNIELIEEPMAAALGAGLDIGRPRGIMVIDIGGGTVDIAVICLNDIVVSESVKCGGRFSACTRQTRLPANSFSETAVFPKPQGAENRNTRPFSKKCRNFCSVSGRTAVKANIEHLRSGYAEPSINIVPRFLGFVILPK